LGRLCRESSCVVDLLEARGGPRFASLSRGLYGSTAGPDGARLLDLARRLAGAVSRAGHDGPDAGEALTAHEAAGVLAERLQRHFRTGPPVRVIVSSAIAADAAVEGTCLK